MGTATAADIPGYVPQTTLVLTGVPLMAESGSNHRASRCDVRVTR